MEEVNDIVDLKNDRLAQSTVINIFDTSTRVPATTVLVDTPGLSSLNSQHKQTLVDFLPQADGVLLVTDVNQQIIRSLTDFILHKRNKEMERQIEDLLAENQK